MPFCDACGAGHNRLDHYCRNCGVRLPADVEQRAVAVMPPFPRALRPWLPNRPTLVRGLAALAAGAAVELVRRRVATGPSIGGSLLSLSRPRHDGRSRDSAAGAGSVVGAGEDVLETIVVHWRRRR